VAVILDCDRVFFFDGYSVLEFLPKYNVDASLVFGGYPECKFRFQDCNGTTYLFDEQGVFVAKLSGGNRIDASLNGDGQIASLSRTTDGVLDEIIIERDEFWRVTAMTSQQTASPTEYIRRVEYTYYGPSEDFGNDGDLKTVTILIWDTVEEEWVPHETSYYRYYKSGDSDGFEHGLKFALGPAAFQRLSDATGGNPLTADDATVALYADRFFKYDPTSHRATQATLNGGLLTFTYSYEESVHADDYANWKLKAVETRPDGATRTVYSNYLSQELLIDLADAGGTQHWIQFFQHNDRGLVTLEAMPSAVEDYNDTAADLGVTLRADAGLLRIVDFYTSTTADETTPGGVLDQMAASYVQEGTGGTPIKQSETEYFVRSATDGFWYPVAVARTFPDATEAGDGDPVETTFAYQWFTDSTQMSQRETTLPVVSTDQNGSGVAAVRRELFDELGNLIATQDERLFITTFVIDPPTGARLQMVQDAAAPSGSGWIRPFGAPTPLALTTDYQVTSWDVPSGRRGRYIPSIWRAQKRSSVHSAGPCIKIFSIKFGARRAL